MKHNWQYYNHSSALYWAILIFPAIAYMIMYGLTPIISDDGWYSQPMAEYMANGGIGNFIQGWIDSVSFHFQCDNGRLANIICSPFLMLPKWLTSIICGIVSIFNICLCAKFVGIWKHHFFAYAILGLLYLVGLPWFDSMFLRNYFLNYVLSSTIVLISSYLFINNRLGILSGILLGLISGAFHEAFGAALLAGSVSLLIFKKDYRKKTNLIFIICILIGLIYLILCPGTRVRKNFFLFMLGVSNPLFRIEFGVIFFTMCGIIIYALCKRKYRKILSEPVNIFSIAAAFGSFVVWRVLPYSARATWPMTLFSLIAITSIISVIISNQKKLYFAIGFIIWGILYTYLAISLPWFVRFYNGYNETVEILEKHPEGVVYSDIVTQQAAPLYLLGRPTFNNYTSYWETFNRVIPTSAISFTEEKARRINSDNGEIWIYNNGFIMRSIPELASRHVSLRVKIFGRSYETYGRILPFKNDKYMYIYVHQWPWLFPMSQVTALEIKSS